MVVQQAVVILSNWGVSPWRRIAPVPSKSRRENWAMSFRKGSKFWIWLGRWYEVWVKTCQAANLKKFCLPNHDDNDGGGWWMVDDDGWWTIDDGPWTIDDGRWMTMVVKVHAFVKACCKVGSCQAKNVDSHLPTVAWNVTFPTQTPGLQIRAVG